MKLAHNIKSLQYHDVVVKEGHLKDAVPILRLGQGCLIKRMLRWIKNYSDQYYHQSNSVVQEFGHPIRSTVPLALRPVAVRKRCAPRALSQSLKRRIAQIRQWTTVGVLRLGKRTKGAKPDKNFVGGGGREGVATWKNQFFQFYRNSITFSIPKNKKLPF